jgi:hypothetical protein
MFTVVILPFAAGEYHSPGHQRPATQDHPWLSLTDICTGQSMNLHSAELVVRGRIELPTFRFSELRIAVHDNATGSILAAREPRWTAIDPRVRT